MQKYTVVVDDEGTIYWHKEGTRDLHRLDGPAIEYTNGDKYWYQSNKKHRLNGPAVDLVDGNKLWYQNDKLHRLDGPACEYADGTKEWHIEHIEYFEHEYLKKIEEMKGA